jgi:hypothetical protein
MSQPRTQRSVIWAAASLLFMVSVSSIAWSQSASVTTSAPPKLMGRTLTAEEASRSGLNKLTEEELAYLEAWLAAPIAQAASESSSQSAAQPTVASASPIAPAATTTSAAAAVDPFDKPKQPPRLVARVLPPFTGWDGRTEFRLDNGQVWRQRLPGRYVHQGGLESPTEVVITRNFFGFFVLTVPSSGRGTGVERIQ